MTDISTEIINDIHSGNNINSTQNKKYYESALYKLQNGFKSNILSIYNQKKILYAINDKILKYCSYRIENVVLRMISNVEFDESLYIHLIEYYNRDRYQNEINKKITDIEKEQITVKLLNIVIQYNYIGLIKIIIKKIKPTEDSLNYALKNNSMEVIQLLCKYDNIITESNMKFAILYKKEFAIIMINNKTPVKTILDFACQKEDPDIIRAILNKDIKPTTNHILISCNSSKAPIIAARCINILLEKDSTILTYDILVHLIQNKIEVNIKYIKEIVFMSNFYEICAKYGFYPYFDITLIHSKKELDLACENCNIDVVKFIIANGIEPDKTSLEMACKNPSNINRTDILYYLINEKKINATIENLNSIYGCNPILKMLTFSYLENEKKNKIN
jgi:hypothetical protein